MTLPEGNRLAALQAVRESFQRFAGPHSTRFGATMAAAESGNRPLLRFGRADWWSKVGESHADYYETIDSINTVTLFGSKLSGSAHSIEIESVGLIAPES